MSTAGQAIGGVVGAVAGFMIGGPTGAMYGAQIGMAAGGYLDPPKGPEQQGPRLSDLSVQTSTYGAFIPRVYGTVAINGNVLWLEKNQLKEVVRKEESGGKGGGGGSSEVTTYSYYATLAIGLCEGPIAGIRRIWAGPNLIYDAGSGTLESVIASNQASQKNFTFYLGTAEQQPDSRMQADLGVANTSAHRGLAYIVVRDFALAKYGNAIPAFKVEVIGQPAWDVNTVVDATPYVQTPMTWESGAAFRDDFAGLEYLSRRLVGSADVSSFWMGKSGPGETITVEFNLDNEPVRGIVSYDGQMWVGCQINDIFNTNKYRRLSDLFYFEIYSDTLVRGIRHKSGAGEDVYLFLYSAGGAGTSGTFTKVGYTQVFADGGILFDGMSATPGYRINTSGNQLHEFSVTTNTISVRVYNDSFVLVDSFTCTAPGSALQTVSGAFPAAGLGPQSCMRDGVFYLCQEETTGYRIVACSADGVIDDFFVLATSGLNELYAFYMVSASAGYIVNGSRIIQFVHYPQGGYPLAKIIESECLRTSLLRAADVDVSAIADTVDGYRVSAIGSVRNAIEPLQGMHITLQSSDQSSPYTPSTPLAYLAQDLR